MYETKILTVLWLLKNRLSYLSGHTSVTVTTMNDVIELFLFEIASVMLDALLLPFDPVDEPQIYLYPQQRKKISRTVCRRSVLISSDTF